MTTPVSVDTASAMAAAGLVPGTSPVPVRLPAAVALFLNRARRLRELAPGHSLAPWLDFVAQLADVQGELVAQAAPEAEPGRQWLTDLRSLVGRLRGRVPETMVDILDRLDKAPAADLDGLAARLQGGEPKAEDLPAAPFAVAALQVAWTRHSSGLTAEAVQAPATAAHCPVCGSAPVAGVIHVGAESGLRYLHCGQCHTAWHHVRASCVACGESKDLSYASLAGEEAGVRAETCGDCKTYLKLFLGDKRPGLDPVADDLATLAVDILVGEEGYQRLGINPYLLMAE